jgi:hypothetical protein
MYIGIIFLIVVVIRALSAIANSDDQEVKKVLTRLIVLFLFGTGIIIAMLILDVSILSLLTIYFYSFPGDLLSNLLSNWHDLSMPRKIRSYNKVNFSYLLEIGIINILVGI